MKKNLKAAALILALGMSVFTGCNDAPNPPEEADGPKESSYSSEAVFEEEKPKEPVSLNEEVSEEIPAEISPESEEIKPNPAPRTEPPANGEKKEASGGIRPEFKRALDEYEEFFNEYCDFMRKYETSDDALGMLADYTKFLTQLADMSEALDALGEEEMNSAELKYYIEVTGRIQQNLASLI